MTENKKITEMHGCIVCGRVFNVLAVYAPDGKLVDCAVTSTGGHCVADERQPLVVCDSHTTNQIDFGHKKWQAIKEKKSDSDPENE